MEKGGVFVSFYYVKLLSNEGIIFTQTIDIWENMLYNMYDGKNYKQVFTKNRLDNIFQFNFIQEATNEHL